MAFFTNHRLFLLLQTHNFAFDQPASNPIGSVLVRVATEQRATRWCLCTTGDLRACTVAERSTSQQPLAQPSF